MLQEARNPPLHEVRHPQFILAVIHQSRWNPFSLLLDAVAEMACVARFVEEGHGHEGANQTLLGTNTLDRIFDQKGCIHSLYTKDW